MGYYIWKSYKFSSDTISLFNALKDKDYCFFLDSSLNANSLGRYSFFGFEPFYILRTKGENPFGQMRSLLNQYKISLKKSFSPFLGGLVGFLGYDLGFLLEKKLTQVNKDDLDISDSFWGVYNFLIIVDHALSRLYIFSCGIPEKSYLLAKLLAKENFKKIERLLSRVRFRKNQKKKIKSVPLPKLLSNFSKEGYCQAIKKAKDYIQRGDIYQVNLSQRFKAKTTYSAFEIYKNLRKISPSFFSAYLDCADFQIISSSPEAFLRLEDSRVWTRPMKGTRPRSFNKNLDKRLKKELLKSAKDKAELTMIVDLERNDLGKVCRYHSVRVESLRDLEEYATVFQTTASVKGILHKDKDRIDLIKACFPGGSITGCPKVRAMEIIEELEPTRRNIYTGSLGYLSFSGQMNLNILIRTILKRKDRVYFGVGGGIVADSQPEDEYQETLVKAKAMTQALGEVRYA